MEELTLTIEQIKVAKSVYRAMRKAAKLGIEFWDDYGTLGCYNGKKIKALHMDDNKGKFKILGDDEWYYEALNNFHSGNADDTIYVEPII